MLTLSSFNLADATEAFFCLTAILNASQIYKINFQVKFDKKFEFNVYTYLLS